MHTSRSIRLTTYNQVEAAKKLGVNLESVRRMRQLGVLPFTKLGRGFRFDRLYIDDLGAKLTLGSLGLRYNFDATFIELYYLGWLHKESARNHKDPKARSTFRKKHVYPRLQVLLEAGEVLTLPALAAKLKSYTSLWSIKRWAKKGRIPTVVIAQHHYLSRLQADRLEWLFGQCLTAVELAEALPADSDTVRKWARAGKLEPLYGPDGVMRFKPASRLVLAEAPDGLPIRQAALRLGLGFGWLKQQVQQGYVAQVIYRGLAYITFDEIERLERQFSTLNSGFEWLQPQLKVGAGTLKTLDPPKAAKLLGLSVDVVNKWGAQNLLPYCTPSFAKPGARRQAHTRLFVQLYLYGLRKFGTTRNKTMRQRLAVEYRTLCARAGYIV